MRQLKSILILLSLIILEGFISMDIISAAVLSHGPLVGAVMPKSAKIWVRTTEPASVQIEYDASPGFGSSLISTEVSTTAKRNLTGIIRLTGLSPSTKYFYRIRINGIIQSEVYQFKTAPPRSAMETFSFAVLSDFRGAAAPVYAKLASEDPVFTIFLGDLDHRNPSTLHEMRKMHRELRGDETLHGHDFKTYITQFPFYHVWDDHDFGIDDANKTFPGKQESLRAFREYFPTPFLPSSDGIWHKFRYAQAEFFMLDLRSQRDPNALPDGPTKSILGASQKIWLKENLLASTAKWKFIMSTVPFNPGTKPYDSWGAFQTERVEIINFIRDQGITGVIVISGDIHSGGALDNGTNSGFPELSVPHANIPPTSKLGSICDTTKGFPGIWSEGILCGIDKPGYGFITVTPDSVTLQVKGIDGTRLSLTIMQN